MKLRNYEIQTLNELGLSILQARAYLALVRLGSAKVKTICKFSNVARSDLYRTLNSLQELGLVEKVIEVPFKFRAIPMDQGLVLLLKRRSEEEKRIRSKTLYLIRDFKKSGNSEFSEANDSKFVLVPSGNLFIARVKTAIDQSILGVDLMLSWKQFSQGIGDFFTENVENALSRNVKFRLIVETSEEAANSVILAQLCKNKCNFKLNFIPISPDYVFGIYDEKKAFIIVYPKTNLADSPAVWTNNQSLISLIHDYFEILWLISCERQNIEKSINTLGVQDFGKQRVLQTRS